MYHIVRSDQEINEVIDTCSDYENEGKTKWRGMTYEQGVKRAILWLTEEEEINPLED